MQSTTSLYNSIMSGAHSFESKVRIYTDSSNYVEYGEDKLFSISISSSLFNRDLPTIGSACASECNLEIETPSITIPRMAKFQVYTRPYNASQTSDMWVQCGEFFVDTRERGRNGAVSTTKIHGYDAMLKAENLYPSTEHGWPWSVTSVVNEIASFMGVTVDSRTYTVMTPAYSIPLPAGYSCREVLGHIAAMYCGNFIITETGKLRLVALNSLPEYTNYLVTENYSPITFGGVKIDVR